MLFSYNTPLFVNLSLETVVLYWIECLLNMALDASLDAFCCPAQFSHEPCEICVSTKLWAHTCTCHTQSFTSMQYLLPEHLVPLK